MGHQKSAPIGRKGVTGMDLSKLASVRFVGGPSDGREINVNPTNLPPVLRERRFESPGAVYRLHELEPGAWQYKWGDHGDAVF
jgi:hypothetical protein